jgi:peptidoglycan/xylan/chitin deacetylase (PgdA/CDA1 family)
MGIRNRRLILVYHTFGREGQPKVRNGRYYGRQGTVHLDILKAHLEWLSEFAHFVSLPEIVRAAQKGEPTQKGKWEVAITLDDGYRNNLTFGLPLFERFQIPVTWFVSTEFVEGNRLPWWDLVDYVTRVVRPSLTLDTGEAEFAFELSNGENRTRFRESCQRWFLDASASVSQRIRSQIENRIPGCVPENAFASRAEIERASQSPWIRLGGHTLSHPNLANRPAQTIREEVKGGKEKLEDWTDQSIQWFAYPYGGQNRWNDTTKQIVQQEGFDGAVTTVRAYAGQADDRFAVPRLTVPNTRVLWKTKAWILATNTCRRLYSLKQRLPDISP